MNTPAHPKSTFASYCFRCLGRGWTDTLEFFKLRTFGSWARVLGPGTIGFLSYISMMKPEDVSKQIPTWLVAAIAYTAWALIVFLSMLILAPYRLYSEAANRIVQLEADIEKLQDAQKPRLEISFHGRDSHVQGTPPNLLYRIFVRNLSEVTSLEDVSVDLQNIKPYGPPYLPLRLHLMNDNLDDKDHSRFVESFTLRPGEAKFVDLVELIHDPGRVLCDIKHIISDVPTLFWVFPEQVEGLVKKVEGLTVVARAKDCPSVSAEYDLHKQGDTYILSATA